MQGPNPIKTRPTKHTVALRVWHWLDLILIAGSLLTVLINETLTSKPSTGDIEATMARKQKTIAHDLIMDINHEYREKVWSLHTYFGYFIVGFLIFRLVAELFMKKEQRFTSKVRKAYSGYLQNKKFRGAAFHEFGIKTVYVIFYLQLIVMAVTGLSLAYDDDVALLKKYHHPIKEVHNFGMYMILGFLVLHIAGIVYAEMTRNKGIVSAMINGREMDI